MNFKRGPDTSSAFPSLWKPISKPTHPTSPHPRLASFIPASHRTPQLWQKHHLPAPQGCTVTGPNWLPSWKSFMSHQRGKLQWKTKSATTGFLIRTGSSPHFLGCHPMLPTVWVQPCNSASLQKLSYSQSPHIPPLLVPSSALRSLPSPPTPAISILLGPPPPTHIHTHLATLGHPVWCSGSLTWHLGCALFRRSIIFESRTWP